MEFVFFNKCRISRDFNDVRSAKGCGQLMCTGVSSLETIHQEKNLHEMLLKCLGCISSLGPGVRHTRRSDGCLP